MRDLFFGGLSPCVHPSSPEHPSLRPSGSAPRVVCMRPLEQHPPTDSVSWWLWVPAHGSCCVPLCSCLGLQVCVCLTLVLSVCMFLCPCCYPENLPGHTMGGSLRILPWPPAQPNSQASVLTLLPGPGLTPACHLHSQGPPKGCSLPASTSGLYSPVYTQQSEGSF